MTLRSRFATASFAVFALLALVSAGLTARQQKPITMEIATATPPLVLTKPLPSVTGWNDGTSYLLSRKKEGGDGNVTVIVDAKSGKELGEKPPAVRWDDYKGIVTESLAVARPTVSDKENRRHLYLKDNDLFLLDTQKKEFRRLTRTPAEELNPTFAPDGRTVAFTRGGNLFTIDLEGGAETQYTEDGSDVVYNGRAAWLYYEEIFGRATRYQAYWWSPDSRRIAFYRFDENDVPMFPIYNSRGQHGTLERTRYPKPGDPNPKVRVGFASVGEKGVTWAGYDEGVDQYFGTPFWTPDAKALWVQWMNRGQDTLRLQSVDPTSGARKEVYTQTQPSWVDWLGEVRFLKKNQGFIIQSDVDGWTHVYRYAMDGSKRKQLTTGAFSVAGIELVDEERGLVYLTARTAAG
jgi:dipeptidyl-peptidase-4